MRQGTFARYLGKRNSSISYRGRVFFESSSPLIGTKSVSNGAEFVLTADSLQSLTSEPIKVYSGFRAASLCRYARKLVDMYVQITGESDKGLFYAKDKLLIPTDELPG